MNTPEMRERAVAFALESLNGIPTPVENLLQRAQAIEAFLAKGEVPEENKP